MNKERDCVTKRLRQIRQGDVLVTRVRAIPSGAAPKDRDAGRVVLAYGEVTGHAHAIMEPEALLYSEGEHLFLEADGTVTLRHEEHAPIQIPRGLYRVTRQREYTPEAPRFVAD